MLAAMTSHATLKPLACALLLCVLALGGCGDTAKPVPVKNNKAPPPYAGHGIDAVGVGKDPSHHSPFGAPSDAEGSSHIADKPAATGP